MHYAQPVQRYGTHINDALKLKGGLALCKGLEPKSNLFAHDVIQDELGTNIGSVI